MNEYYNVHCRSVTWPSKHILFLPAHIVTAWCFHFFIQEENDNHLINQKHTNLSAVSLLYCVILHLFTFVGSRRMESIISLPYISVIFWNCELKSLWEVTVRRLSGCCHVVCCWITDTHYYYQGAPTLTFPNIMNKFRPRLKNKNLVICADVSWHLMVHSWLQLWLQRHQSYISH